MEEKKALRKQFSELLRGQKKEDWFNKSRVIHKRFFALEEYRSAKTILMYASFAGEVDTFAIIEQALQSNKKVALPIIMRNQRKLIPRSILNVAELQVDAYGISTPSLEDSQVLDIKDLDLVVVPGLGFDRCGNRLGRGLGYYDRFLQHLPESVTTIGLAFDFQLVDSLPIQGHDAPLDRIVSN